MKTIKNIIAIILVLAAIIIYHQSFIPSQSSEHIGEYIVNINGQFKATWCLIGACFFRLSAILTPKKENRNE